MYTMVEFRTMYYQPMDRNYNQSVTEVQRDVKLEKPIMPINRLGETVPEALGGRNILQTTEAAIRGGAGVLQLVLVPPQDSIGGTSIGARIGTEVREALRELALANKVEIAGVELPTAVRGLSGFDFQQNAFSEDVRQRNLQQVKDAIKFAADVGRGGGIDLLSWEFSRGVSDTGDKNFVEPIEQQDVRVVDKKSGRTFGFRKADTIYLPLDPDNNFKKVEFDPEQGKIDLKPIKWQDFEKWAKSENEKAKKEGKEQIAPEVRYYRERLEADMKRAQGTKSQAELRARDTIDGIKRINEQIKEAKNEEDKKTLEKNKHFLENQRDEAIRAAEGHAQEIKNIEQTKDNITSLNTFGLQQAALGYAEAGVFTWREFQAAKEKNLNPKPMHIGPEIGWPEFYGSHPEEFKNVIIESRKKMVELLTNPELTLPSGAKRENPHFQKGLSPEEAQKLAKEHIKGLFDTSHMGMWLAHFKPNVGENEDDRIKRFNKWYVEEVEKLAKDPRDLIGGIQLVDSHSAAHGHLPPGEGIFPVIKTAEIFEKTGFKGMVVSEGHEEERFGQGRIRMKTWQHANANIGQGYFSGPPLQWGQVQSNYFGRTYSPLFMFGSYSPSNDFKLWSEVPLE